MPMCRQARDERTCRSHAEMPYSPAAPVTAMVPAVVTGPPPTHFGPRLVARGAHDHRLRVVSLSTGRAKPPAAASERQAISRRWRWPSSVHGLSAVAFVRLD